MKNRKIPQLFPTDMRWDEERRQNILHDFKEEVYGHNPIDGYSVSWKVIKEEAFKDLGTKRVVEIYIDAPKGSHSFPLFLFIPKVATQEMPAPVMLSICIKPRVPHSQGLPKVKPCDLENDTNEDNWPVEDLLRRGYAVATYYTEDLEPDRETEFKLGIIRYFDDIENREANRWGAIAAWAFGASRVIDYLVTDSSLDKNKISVIGHSRGGKTALWCAANDPRVYSCYANNSGCTGAALSRGKKGEDIFRINTGFPYWFCENYKKYNHREEALPIDQHMLLALVAPRPLYLASASEDLWADPESEFDSAVLASEVYEHLGLRGLDRKKPLEPGQHTHKGQIGYHVRKGRHAITKQDWMLFCDFLESK